MKTIFIVATIIILLPFILPFGIIGVLIIFGGILIIKSLTEQKANERIYHPGLYRALYFFEDNMHVYSYNKNKYEIKYNELNFYIEIKENNIIRLGDSDNMEVLRQVLNKLMENEKLNENVKEIGELSTYEGDTRIKNIPSIKIEMKDDSGTEDLFKNKNKEIIVNEEKIVVYEVSLYTYNIDTMYYNFYIKYDKETNKYNISNILYKNEDNTNFKNDVISMFTFIKLNKLHSNNVKLIDTITAKYIKVIFIDDNKNLFEI